MTILFTNIKSLVDARNENILLHGSELLQLLWLCNAYLIVEDNTAARYGSIEEIEKQR